MKKTIALISLIALVVALTVTVIVLGVKLSSKNNEEPDVLTPGPESGLYYFDDNGKEYTLQLHSGDQFTLFDGETKTGTYTVAEDGTLTLTFAQENDGTANGKVADDVITLTYNGAEARFLRKIYYSVSFSTDGGSAIDAIPVVNGRYATNPSDPVKADHVFLGWYSDAACKTPFVFASTAITSDVTLYARWAYKAPGVPEYTVSFEGASVDAMSTIGGKLYGLPTPEKEGYTFGGWWISMGDSAEKLTVKYTEGTAFSENDTLYALWIPEGSNAPIVEVSSDKVTWDRIDGAIHYSLKIYDPSGSLVYEGNETGTSYKYNFTTPGEYKVLLSASVNGTTTEVTERYYVAKALGKVYDFQVVEPSILVFNKVPNAQEYILNIVCGNPAHDHSAYNNGNSTVYNFANCDMVEGGISFIVTARAEGYADSVSQKFVFERRLNTITDITVNNDILSWIPVDKAEEYVVEITIGDNTYTYNTKSCTYDLKYIPGGDVTVSIKAVAKGYVTPAATVYTFAKESLAAPSQSSITVSGSVISWDAIAGDNVSYIVYINGNAYPTPTNSINLSETSSFSATAGDVLNISVASVTETTVSTPSDSISVNYGVFAGYLTYGKNTLSWSAVLGIEGKYEVQVGNSASTFVTGTSATIAFTKGGVNTVAVRFVSDDYTSDWLRTNLYVYTITFDARLGASVAPMYFVTGDNVTLPAGTTRTGYTFANWYDSTDVNGKLITSGEFNYTDNVTLYAHWTPNTYYAIVDGAPDDVVGVENGALLPVKYDNGYTLPVPSSDAGQFIGWFTGADGTGLQLTNDEGVSIGIWTFTEDTKVYPKFASNLLKFVERTDGTWGVTSGPDVASVTKIIVPATYQNKPVTAILENAFKKSINLKTISIPNSVNVIGVGAFDTAYYLESITIREVEGVVNPIFSSENGALVKNDVGVKYLEFVPRANAGLNGTFTVPSSATAIRNKAFQHTNLINKVIIPTGVTSIADQAFYHCDKLTEIEFMNGGNSPLSITSGAFYYTDLINTIKLPARLASLSAVDTFDALPKLANIYVEDGGEFYGAIDGILTNGAKDTLLYAPVNFTGVVDIPNGVTAIGDSAFANRTGVTSVIIPNWVTSIGNSAFENATGITSVTIKGGKFDGLTIGTKAFAGCKNNATLTIEGGNTADGKITVGDYAFANNTKLSKTDVAADANVSSIGAYAFSGCSAISQVTIQNTTTYIGERAYAQCIGISKVTFAEGVNTEFGAFVFEGCQKLSSISLPASLQTFDGSVFAGCNNIEAIEVAADSTYLAAVDGVLYDAAKTTILYYPKAKAFDLASLPATVTKIGNAAFQGNVKVEALTIPANITEIGDYAFEGCVYLENLDFAAESQLTTLGKSAFANCTSLASVTLPAGVEVIGEKAFYLADIDEIALPANLTTIGAYAFAKTNIAAITIPSKVATIAEGAFSDCAKLKNITVEEGDVALNIGSLNDKYGVFEGSASALGKDDNATITLAKRVEVVGSRAFYSLVKVNALTIPADASLKAIGDWAFYYNKFDHNLTLPEGLTYIGAHAFDNCIGASFKTVTIPSTVTEIGEYAFQNCTILTTVTISDGAEGTTGLSLKLNSGIFAGSSKITKVTLPAHLTEAYELTSTAGGLQITTFADMFKGCSALTKIEVNDNCTQYGDIDGIFGEKNAEGKVTRIIYCPIKFAGNSTTTKQIKIPYYVTNIDNGAFNALGNTITTVVFEDDPNWGPNSTPTLVIGNANYRGYNAEDDSYPVFKSSYLTSIDLPVQLKSLGFGSFHTMSKLTTLAFDQNSAPLEIVGQRAIYKLTATGFTTLTLPKVASLSENAITENSKITSISFAPGSTFTEIPYHGIYKNVALKAFEIPAQVTTIHEWGLSNNSALASLTFAAGSQIRYIGDYAFNTTAITSFVFPDTNEPIKLGGDKIFAGCSKLTELTLNNHMTGLYADNGVNLIANNTNITAIHVSKANPYLASDSHGIIFNKDMTQLLYCPPKAEILDYTIPSTVTSIEDNALTYFGVYGGESKLTLPSGLLSIGENALMNSYVTTLVIPASVQVIKSGAFASMTSLTSITFEANSALVEIGTGAFMGCNKIKSIDIPDSVTTLGDDVFKNCSALGSKLDSDNPESAYGVVDLPASLITLPSGTFAGCTSLTSIVLKEGLENISGDVFSGCSALTSISFPASLKSITTNGNGVFYGCSNLESVEFPAGANISNISANVFVNCNKLTSITLPASVATLSYGMLKGCANIDTITINGNIESIPDGMFKGFANLKYINIPTSVTEIGVSAFEDCTSLESITLPEGLAKIGNSAFRGCTSLKGIEFGENVTEIGNYAFENCTALASVTFSSDIAIKALGVSPSTEAAIFRNTPALTSIELPDSITTIGARLFENSGIQSIKLSANLTAISEYAFSGCKNLETLTLPGAVKDIYSYAFLDCENLASIDIATGVETLGTAIFMNCTSLESVSIPATINNIAGNPFINCPALSNIVFDNNNANYVYEGNMILDADRFTLVYYSPAITDESPALPATVRAFASGAFYGAKIKSFIIPETLTEIPDMLFMNCTNLSSITIPNNITRIGDKAFMYSAITSVQIPKTLTEIGEYAFAECTSLTSVEFDTTRKTNYTIGIGAFENATSLATIKLANGLTALTPYMFANTGIVEFTLPESVTNVNVEGVFYGCTNLVNVTMHDNVGDTLGDKFFMNCSSLEKFDTPASITRIGEFAAIYASGDSNRNGVLDALEATALDTTKASYAFKGCTSLESVDLTNVYWIGAYAFEDCTSLASVTFGYYLSVIGDYAFNGCTGLETIDFSNVKEAWFNDQKQQEAQGLRYDKFQHYFMFSNVVFGKNAFSNCTSLNSVVFSKTFTKWTAGAGMFDGCTSLKQSGFTNVPSTIKNSASYKALPKT